MLVSGRVFFFNHLSYFSGDPPDDTSSNDLRSLILLKQKPIGYESTTWNLAILAASFASYVEWGIHPYHGMSRCFCGFLWVNRNGGRCWGQTFPSFFRSAPACDLGALCIFVYIIYADMIYISYNIFRYTYNMNIYLNIRAERKDAIVADGSKPLFE